MNLLRRIAERRGGVTFPEYFAAVRGRISSRQASRDLRDAPFLEKEGRTRGARYRLRGGRRPRTPPATEKLRNVVAELDTDRADR